MGVNSVAEGLFVVNMLVNLYTAQKGDEMCPAAQQLQASQQICSILPPITWTG
jgi:hypothetical protein